MGVMRADGGGLEKAKKGDAGVGEAEQELEEKKTSLPAQHFEQQIWNPMDGVVSLTYPIIKYKLLVFSLGACFLIYVIGLIVGTLRTSQAS